MEGFLVRLFVESQPVVPEQIVRMWTPRMIRCMDNRKDDSFTDTSWETYPILFWPYHHRLYSGSLLCAGSGSQKLAKNPMA